MLLGCLDPGYDDGGGGGGGTGGGAGVVDELSPWHDIPKEAHCSLATKGRVSVPNRGAGNLPRPKPSQRMRLVGWASIGLDPASEQSNAKQAKRLVMSYCVYKIV